MQCEHCGFEFHYEPFKEAFCSLDCQHDHENEAWENRAYPPISARELDYADKPQI
jgi:hypothetical protein